MNRSIVCGLDGSHVSHWAARVAAELARALDLELVLAHVADDPPTFPYGDNRLRELQRREAAKRSYTMLEEVAATLCSGAPALRVVLGDPLELLTAMSREDEVELLVVGSRGRRPLAAAVLGSVSSRLATAAGCPVVVVPSADAARRLLSLTDHSTVLCGVDGSAGSMAALAFAADVADWLELELVPLHIDESGTWEPRPPDTTAAALEVDVGDPIRGLLERASDQDAGMLVLGSPGTGRWRAIARGSVSRELAASAPLPVIIVPSTERSLAGITDVMVAGFDDADR